MLPRSIVLGLLGALCLGLVGCGGGGVDVEGKVVKGGAPYTLAEGEGINVQLTSEDGKTSGSGKVEQDGSFKVKGSDGGALPAGKYKVGYVHYPPPAKDSSKGAPMPQNRTTSEVWDVSASNKSFTLDIGTAKK